MIGIGIANSLGVNLSGLSPAAKSFVTAAGISDPTKVKAINDLVIGLQSSGLWSKMKAVYPFVTDNRNLLGYTEDFSNAAWTKESATITSNSVIAPNGTTTADTFTATATNALHYLSQNVSITTGNIITFSCYVKNNGGNFVQLVAGASDFIPISPYQNFNLQTGTLASGNITNSTITNVGNGWFRITSNLTCTSTGTASFFIVPILNGITGRVDAFTGDGTSGIYIWGAQLELGSTATTYQPIATTQQAFISNQFKYNLKDPRDTDAAFRLVFNGGWSFSSTGATPNGVNGYADTKLVPSSSLSTSSAHLSFYSRTNINQNTYDFSAGQHYSLLLYNNTFYVNFETSGQYNATQSLTNTTGYYIGSRINNTSVNGYRNGIKTINNVAQNSTLSASPLLLSSSNASLYFSTKQIAFATIGDGLTDDDATNLYYYTQVFQTTLGRQIGSPAYALPTTYDASAKLYLSAIGSTTDSTLNNAVDTFIKGLKADGIYSKMKAVYPFATDNRNLFSYTEDFGNAFWYKNAVTITTNSVIAPNGTLTADSIVENTANTDHYVGVLSGLTLTAVPYTLSVYLKKAGRDWCSVGLFNGVDSKSAWFNLNTGVIGTINSGITANIESVGDGWYRCSVTRTMAANSNNYIGIGPAISDGGGAYLGNGSTSIYLWGAQLELGSTATTYQPILTTQQAYISSQFKYNLVNPVDSDAAFRLVFNGGWTHSANGATPNGTNGYADTKLVPSSVLTNNNYHLSHYSRTQNILGSKVDIGSVNPAPRMISLTQYYGSLSVKGFVCGDYNTLDIRFNNTDTLGLMVGSRTSQTSAKMFMDGVQTGATQTISNPNALPTSNIFIGATGNGGTGQEFSDRQVAFSSIGDGLTDTEAANLYTRVQAFQNSLNRAVI